MSQPETSLRETRIALTTGRVGMAALFLISLAALIGSITTLEFGTTQQPGAGFWITLVSTISLILSGVGVAVPAVASDEVELAGREELRAVFLAVPALLLSAPLLTLIGAVPTALLLGFYWLKIPLRSSWLRSVIVSAAIAASIYVVFIALLRVPFPAGSIVSL